MERKKLVAIALLPAAIPTMRWYALRLQDGGGELVGLFPLVAAVWFWVRDWKGLGAASWEIWTAAALLLVQAGAYSFLPAILRAVLMLLSVVCVSGTWRKPGVVCLLLLALPWMASLEFYLGYPLRLLTSVNAEMLLNLAGADVNRTGVQLLYEGRTVGVDPACSGMNMLWSTGLLTALLAARFSLRWIGLVPLGIAALVLALAGNSLRASILFFPESGLVEMPTLLHPGIGIAIYGGCFLLLMRLARRVSASVEKLKDGDGCQNSRAYVCATLAALLVVSASLVSVKESPQSMATTHEITNYEGAPVTRISLTPAEETFYGSFPGSVAVYEGTDFKLIVRQINRATRKLHPASHCLRAEGFRIGEKTVVNEDGVRWITYSVRRNSETFQVKEHITNPASGENWPEVSAWYWHALFHSDDGPWEAVTVIATEDGDAFDSQAGLDQ